MLFSNKYAFTVVGTLAFGLWILQIDDFSLRFSLDFSGMGTGRTD